MKKGPKISFWGSNWTRKFLYGLLFVSSKHFRLHAILHDAIGYVKSTTYKGPGFCYVLPRIPGSCFLAYVTGFFFCLKAKNFASFNF